MSEKSDTIRLCVKGGFGLTFSADGVCTRCRNGDSCTVDKKTGKKKKPADKEDR